MTRPALLVALWGLLGGLPEGFGQEPSRPEIASVRVGFAGHYKPGLWTPVEVTVRGGSEPLVCRLTLTVPDGDGVPSRYATPPDAPCRLSPGQESSVLLYVRFGRAESSLLVELDRDRQPVATRVFQAGGSAGAGRFPRALPSNEQLIVVVGSDVPAVDEAVVGLHRKAGEHATAARLDDFRQMPSRWCGYEGADAVILSASRPETYRGLKPGSPQIAALDEWVRLGGTLVLCAGGRGDELLREGAAWSLLAPGKFQRVLSLEQSGALESYCGSSVSVPRSGAGGRLDLRASQLADVQGAIEAREGAKLPLVVRTPRGFGQVVFAAVDLGEPPLSRWTDRGLLVRKFLGIAESRIEDTHESGAVMHYGFDDLAGQLRSALDQFEGVPAVSFELVVAIMVGYLLLIGPLDYFFLRKVVGRMVLTWVTFPVVALVFCLGAYAAAHWLKGDEVRVNQVDLVDVDAASGLLRGTSWANVFSPRTQPYRLAFQPRLPGGRADARAAVLTSWLGLPGDFLGGMDPKTAAPTVWKDPYDSSPGLDTLEGVPIQNWSTKSFCARWTVRAAPCVEAELAERDRTPVGTVTNRLDVPLSDCMLCYGRWVYDLGTLAPGQSAGIEHSQERRDLKTLLTGRKPSLEEGRHAAMPYDQASTDVDYILRAMTFFEAVGGYYYVRLTHRYQGFTDLSDLLKTGHAILWASGPAGGPQSPHHGARLLSDGRPLGGPQDRHTTIYRFVLPVKKAGSARE